MPPPIRGMRAAFVFLTRIPAGGFPYSDEDYAWAPAHGPLVGLVVGGAGAAVFALLIGAGATPAALVALTVTMLLTGGFHEDGLADSADALGGAIFDRERLLVILKDSRIGTYGALAVAVTVGLRTLLIGQVATEAAVHTNPGLAGAAALVLSHTLARVAPTWLMATMPYVTDAEHAKSRPIVRAGRRAGIIATLWGAAVLVAAWAWLPDARSALWILVPSLVVASALCAWRFHRRVGGITGDFLGATEQVGEMTVLLVLAAAL